MSMSPPGEGGAGGASYSLRPHVAERRAPPAHTQPASADASSPAGQSWRAGHGGEPGGGHGGGGGVVGSAHSGGGPPHQAAALLDVSDAHGLHRRRRSDDLGVMLESPQRHAALGGGHHRGHSSGTSSSHVAGAPRDLLVGMTGLTMGSAPAVTVLRRGGPGAGAIGEPPQSGGTLPPASWQPTQPAASAVLVAPAIPAVLPPSSLPGEPPLPPTWPPPAGQLKLTPQQLADVLELKAAKIQAQAVAAAAAAQEAKVAAAAASGSGIAAVASPAHVPPHSDTHAAASPPVPPGPPPASALVAAPVAMQLPPALPPGKPTAPRSALVDPFPGTGGHTAPVRVPIAVCGPAGAAASAHPTTAAVTAPTTGSSSAYASVTAGVISATSDRHGRFTALLGPTGQAHPAKSTPTQQPPSAAPSPVTAASGSSAAPAPAPAAAPPSFHTVLVCAPVVEPIASCPVPHQQQQQPLQAAVRSSPSTGGGSASTPPLPPGPPPPGQPRVALAETVEASQMQTPQTASTEGGPGGLLRASTPQLLPRTVTTGGVTTPALVPRTHSAARARGPSVDDGHVTGSSTHRAAPHRPISSQPPGMPHGGGGGSAHGAPPSAAATTPEAAPGASADPDGWRTVGVPKRRLSGGRHTAEREAWPEVAVPWLGTAPTPAWQPAPAAGIGHAAGNGGTSDKV